MPSGKVLFNERALQKKGTFMLGHTGRSPNPRVYDPLGGFALIALCTPPLTPTVRTHASRDKGVGSWSRVPVEPSPPTASNPRLEDKGVGSSPAVALYSSRKREWLNFELCTLRSARAHKEGCNQSPMNGAAACTLLSTLKTFASQGDLRKAFLTYSILTTHLSSSSSTLLITALTSLLLPCISSKSLRFAQPLHSIILSLAHHQHPLLAPMLVHFYSSCSLFNDAYLVVQDSNSPNHVPWNVFISSCVRHGASRLGILAYNRMLDAGLVKPDAFTYTSVLKACTTSSISRECGWWVHSTIDYACLRGNVRVQTSLVSMYLKCGRLNIARSLFEKMPVRNVVSWNCMISGYAAKGMMKEALELFERMWVEQVDRPNVVTWNIIATMHLHVGDYNGVLDLISKMTVAEFVSVRCKYTEYAYKLFVSAKEKSVVTWNAMITGLSNLDMFEEADSIFRDMLAYGFEPNEVTILTILSICARMSNLRHGRELHCYILRRAAIDDHYLFSYNSLVHLYANSGKVLEARILFDSMEVKDKFAYTSLISGYAMQGRGREALELFEEMILYGMKPDRTTMLVVLSACTLSRFVNEGQELFKKMVEEYEIDPQMEHFHCMVDLFGRVGLIDEAEKVIKEEMPFDPSPGIWKSLLWACRRQGNVEIGEWAADKLLDLRPHELEVYELIASMYNLTASWSKLAKVRKLMEPLCTEKKDEKSDFAIDLEHQHWEVSHL
ncbi:hypothetical protein Syun_029995 [Stephania yunnanensis]|uniref:Pentatricopeptide repeat-containing protein n=1 Tax=Stephania yunnanensis TaxID=152371 RepID=A0AAP0HKD3_9MAGN